MFQRAVLVFGDVGILLDIPGRIEQIAGQNGGAVLVGPRLAHRTQMRALEDPAIEQLKDGLEHESGQGAKGRQTPSDSPDDPGIAPDQAVIDLAQRPGHHRALVFGRDTPGINVVNYLRPGGQQLPEIVQPGVQGGDLALQRAGSGLLGLMIGQQIGGLD